MNEFTHSQNNSCLTTHDTTSRRIIIDRAALSHNFNTIKNRTSAQIMAIVKANAYGHGLVPCAQTLAQCNADYFGVALIEEAIQMRTAGIKTPILVLGAIPTQQIPLFFQYTIEITAASIEKLSLINAYAQRYKTKARVHLKIDTGLGRIGVRHTNAERFFEHAIALPHIDIVGIMSHLATAENVDTTFLHEQIERFYYASLFFEKRSLPLPLRHIANSAATIQTPLAHFDMIRPGIMLYGIYPHSWMQSHIFLKPVLSLHAQVVYFKVALHTSGISYGHTWRAPKNTRIITIPIGYGDGYPRALSNKGRVLLAGKKYPIAGTICMDQMMINIDNATAYNGDWVTLIGQSKNETITVNELADLYGGSPYELTTMLNTRIERQYV